MADIRSAQRLAWKLYKYGSEDGDIDPSSEGLRGDIFELANLLERLDDTVGDVGWRFEERELQFHHQHHHNPLSLGCEAERQAFIGDVSATLMGSENFLKTGNNVVQSRRPANHEWHLKSQEPQIHSKRQRLRLHSYKIQLAIDILNHQDGNASDGNADQDTSHAYGSLLSVQDLRKIFGEVLSSYKGPKTSSLAEWKDRYTGHPGVLRRLESAGAPATGTADFPLREVFDAVLTHLVQVISYQRGPDRYLELLKCCFLLEKTKSSFGYQKDFPGLYFEPTFHVINEIISRELRLDAEDLTYNESVILRFPNSSFEIWPWVLTNETTLGNDINPPMTHANETLVDTDIHAQLDDSDSDYFAKIFRRPQGGFRIAWDPRISATGKSNHWVEETIFEKDDRLVPRYLDPQLAESCLEIGLLTGGKERVVRFSSHDELLQFQAALTGYDVTHDHQSLIVCQFSQRTKSLDCADGHIQLWQKPIQPLGDTYSTETPLATPSVRKASYRDRRALLMRKGMRSEESKTMKLPAITIVAQIIDEKGEERVAFMFLELQRDMRIDSSQCNCNLDYDKCSKLVLVDGGRKNVKLRVSLSDQEDIRTLNLLKCCSSSPPRTSGIIIKETKYLMLKFASLRSKKEFHNELNLRFRAIDAQVSEQRSFSEGMSYHSDQPKLHDASAFSHPSTLSFDTASFSSAPSVFSSIRALSTAGTSVFSRKSEVFAIDADVFARGIGNEADQSIGINIEPPNDFSLPAARTPKLNNQKEIVSIEQPVSRTVRETSASGSNVRPVSEDLNAWSPWCLCPELSANRKPRHANRIGTSGRDPQLGPAFRSAIISRFTDELVHRLGHTVFAILAASATSSILLEFSKISQFRAGAGCINGVRSFIGHERHKITHLIQQRCGGKNAEATEINQREDFEPNWRETASQSLVAIEESQDGNERSKYPSEALNDTVDSSGNDKYLQSITNRTILTETMDSLIHDAAFDWLLARLKLASTTKATGPAFQQTYHDLKVSISKCTELFFDLEWDPFAFLLYEYKATDALLISDVICIVGSLGSAEATTIGQYVARTWPLIGMHVVQALEGAIRSKSVASNGVTDQVWYESKDISLSFSLKSRVSVGVRSSHPVYIVETGEVLAFLTTACRSSYQANHLDLCHPNVSATPSGHQRNRITIEQSSVSQGDDPQDEACWHAIFNNPTVAFGYPILRRENQEPGLQISLEMMTTLACSTRATVYNGSLLLKSFCSMFVPVVKNASSIVWHYLLNSDFSWMSHNKAEESCKTIAYVDSSALSNSAHFVGWTANVINLTGTTEASYDSIANMNCPVLQPGFAFGDITLGFSKIIEASVKITPGLKDSRLFHLSEGPYARIVDIASKMSTVLYDSQDNRGWLISGTDALLHLSRAALTSQYAPTNFQPGCRSPPVTWFTHKLCTVEDSYLQTSADTLLNANNRRIVLYDHSSKPWHFENLVLEIWEILSLIRSHWENMRSGAHRKTELRDKFPNKIMGFGFTDIISQQMPLRPRYAKLDRSAGRWLKFVNEIGAITLLGSGFGQLLKADPSLCKRALVPSGLYVFATPVLQLQSIVRMYGQVSEHDGMVQLANGTWWNTSRSLLTSDPCACSPGHSRGWCTRLISELQARPKAGTFSRFKKKVHSTTNDFDNWASAAVIFGTKPTLRRLGASSENVVVPNLVHPSDTRGSDSGIDIESSLSTSST